MYKVGSYKNPRETGLAGLLAACCKRVSEAAITGNSKSAPTAQDSATPGLGWQDDATDVRRRLRWSGM
eukprot:2738183-Rhodomonas_salina.1